MNELLEDVGRLLWGRSWVSVMAHEMEISERTIQRWHAGKMIPPRSVWVELRNKLSDVAGQYERASARAGAEAARAFDRNQDENEEKELPK